MQLKSLWPKSLLARTLWLTLLAVFFAQLISTMIWYSQSKQRDLKGLESTSASMATMFASTVNFFQSLPTEYRHIVLDQLRNMGGTRFFVSFNSEEIRITPIANSELKQAAISTFETILHDKLPQQDQIKVEFSRPETLHVLKNDILLSDLPKSWAHYTFSLEPLSPPILVVQIQLEHNQWLYIAALLPAPYMMLEDQIMTSHQVFSLLFTTLLLLVFTYLMISKQTKPLKRLANAANALSLDIYQPPIKEEGASEIVTATRAFNRMQLRLMRYIDDREKLFSSISHDLKTPITRLRLRAELIDDESKIEKFNRDLDELEMMVKGALQCVRDTDLHENLVTVDVLDILHHIAEGHNSQQRKVRILEKPIAPLMAKPLALKRCFTNLIDNGVKYGERVTVLISDESDALVLIIKDQGKGIPLEQQDAVFEPYYRLAKDKDGHGLGMGIARNIVRAHGGDLTIHNANDGGLEVKVFLPRFANNQ
ncbi:Osmolarity sensor protein EnvZ [Photobacterium damselae subsp. piscicida]|uniref:histidine kinase n=1 Tax=Photobacterium damsela subsp. piscicida TaxID=38294 RepID=A0A1V1VFG4_PHODP|nr:ATP-binding protein [Photobacterium damselae]MBE8126723.1 HAMP domain-containing protein [Photobacterium damselae subsp. piscicida]PSV66645.1 HAMP domain-containing protein [Photobacterium damselae]PSW76748.1 HAMP domain-containing protein [Photobacterium damselae]QOD54484.1 HAMP domain-containing protein [Photobacterium damselae subsp. piscicida]QOD58700.1 HAMP domain-containing protein [Photobacterium damselae subsp. piscicida]